MYCPGERIRRGKFKRRLPSFERMSGSVSSEPAEGFRHFPTCVVKVRCLEDRLRLTSTCSRESSLLPLPSPKKQAVAALRVQSSVVGTRYPQYMGFYFLTRSAFRHYSSCNPCLPRASGEAFVRTVSGRHLISKHGRPGRPPARFVQTVRQPAQPEAHQDRPVVARDVRMMERRRSRSCSN